MNERDKLIAKLIKEKGGSREDYLKLLDSIAYHESGHTMDPTTKQIGGGPGRGKYQFEAGKNAGGITAARRTVKYYKDNNIPVPTWLSSAASGDDLDATALSSEQQDILFLGNMREHPKANFSNVWEGKKSIKDFWLDNHWAGGAKERAKRSKSFDSSMESRKDNPKTQQSITSTREEGEFIPPFTKEEFRARENNPANIDKKKEFNLYDYKKVRESRKGPYPHIEGQEKGTTSSHLMSYSENDNGYEAFPTLFQDGKDWKQLPWRRALDKARSEGESYNFRTEQGAKDFAGGEWKEKNEQPTTLPSDFMGNLSQYAKGGLISTDPPVYLASSNQKALGGSFGNCGGPGQPPCKDTTGNIYKRPKIGDPVDDKAFTKKTKSAMDMVAYNLVNQIEGNNKRAGAGAFTNTERDSIVKETRNRLYETARMSGSPQVDASPSSLFNYSHYNPFTNNITIKDYNDLIDEYGHSYKEYAENKSNVVDFLKSYIKKPWVNRKQQSKTYDTPGQLEFDVHQNVAPVLKNYVTYGGSTKDIQPTIEEFRRMDEEVENNNTTNQKALGGSLPASAYIGEGNFYGGGDIHENMKNGGIRVGVGENGKYNTVEKDEFTFNFKDGKYAYSNRLSSGGLVTNDTNAYADGGLVTDPVKKGPTSAVPSLATPSFNPITSSIFNPPKSSTQQFTKTEMKPVGLGLKKVEEKFEVPDVRKQYTHGNVVAPGQEANVQFQQAVQDPSANEFLNRYNNDWSRQKLQEQAGLSNENIDNMILRGLSPKKVIGGNEPNSKASVDRDNNIINIGAQFNNEPGIETHERVHSSMFDAAQGDNLMNVLGNPFQQEGRSMLKGSSLGRETIGNLKKPHEAYGNFAEFREKLGLKPGEQLTEEELKKRVKAKKLSNENFYKVYNDKNITKALNTIAANAKRRGNNTRLT